MDFMDFADVGGRHRLIDIQQFSFPAKAQRVRASHCVIIDTLIWIPTRNALNLILV